VLRLLADSDGEVSAAVVASSLGLSSGTANRVLRALEVEGFVAQNRKRETYYLGSTAILLGQAAQHGFGLDRTLPILERVNSETGESVNLVVREGDESVVIMRVQSTLPLRFEQRPGARFPLYTTASGKAILAFSPDADGYVKSLPRKLKQLTAHTLSAPSQLAAQLKEIGERGYSIDEQENVAGVRCVGAPILDSYGHAQAALVIQVPTVRMPPERVAELGAVVVQVAMEIAQLVPLDRRLSH
jgi:IclR family acetate operon transcriptional repressor